MPAQPPASGDAERDRLLAELFQLHDRLHARSLELVGPMDLPVDLTMQQLRVLGVVAQEPGLTGHALGRSLGVSAPTASGLVDRLAEKGLLERVEDARDRRVRRLHLTPEGARTVSGVDSIFGRLMATVIPPIPTAELATIKAGSEAMLRAIDSALAARRAAADVS